MAWLTTSKIARKAGHVQTAYSAILQAMSLHAPFAFVQQAKLLRANGQPLKALSELENMLPTLRTDSAVINLSGHPTPLHEEPFQSRQNVALAKVSAHCTTISRIWLNTPLRLCRFRPGGPSKRKGWTRMTSSSDSRKPSS